MDGGIAVQNISSACHDPVSQGIDKDRCYAGSQDEAFQRFHKDVHAPQSSFHSSLLDNTGGDFKAPSSSSTSIKRERPGDFIDDNVSSNSHKKMADYFVRSILRASSQNSSDLDVLEVEEKKCLSDSEMLDYEDEDFDAEFEEDSPQKSKKARVEDIVSNVKRRQKRKQSSPQPISASLEAQGLIRNEIAKVKEQLTVMQSHYSKLLSTRSPETNSDVENNNTEMAHNDSLNDTDLTGSTDPPSADQIKSSPENESRGLPPYLTEMQIKSMTESLKKQMSDDVGKMVDSLMGKIRDGVRAQMRNFTSRLQEQQHHQQRPMGMYGFGMPGSMDDLRFPKPHALYPFPEFGRRLFDEPWRPLPPQFPCPPPLPFYASGHLPPPLFKKENSNPILGLFPNEQNEALPLVVNTPKKKRTKVTDTRLSPRAGRLLSSDNGGRDSAEPCYPVFSCVPGMQNPYANDMLGFRGMDVRDCASPMHHQESRMSSPGSYSRDTGLEGESGSYDGIPQTTTLTPIHLRKAKLLFFYNRYPSSQVLKAYFPDVKFNKNNTAQLVKWFSNFREFFYIQMEKYARQAIVEGVSSAEDIIVTNDSEIYRILNLHYNRNNQIEVPEYFRSVVEATLREFFKALSANKDQEQSWKKPIYKVIARMDQPVPEFFKSPNWMEKLADV